MCTIKERICIEARRLFNEKGYDHVSLRDIAEAAGTTIGNLTYHYPKKEHLLTTLQEKFHTGYVMNLAADSNANELLEHLIFSFFQAETNRIQNPFYYKNIFELCKNSKTLNQQNQEFRKKLFDYYSSVFSILKTAGILKNDFSVEQYNTLAYTAIVLSNVWIQEASPYYDNALPSISLADGLCRLLRPYVVNSQYREYDAICTRYRNMKPQFSCDK